MRTRACQPTLPIAGPVHFHRMERLIPITTHGAHLLPAQSDHVIWRFEVVLPQDQLHDQPQELI
jgi:hypothetical protein